MIVNRDHLQYHRFSLLGVVLIFLEAALTAFLHERPAVLEDDDAGVTQLAGPKDSIEERDWRGGERPHLLPWLPSNLPIHLLHL